MCWYHYNINGTAKKDEPICYVAETDIQTYKVMKLEFNCLRSYFMHTPYDVGLEAVGKRLIVGYAPSENSYVITEGFHSYDADKCHLKTTECGNVIVMRGSIDIQWYAVEDMEYRHTVLASCVIPYYVNGIGEVVSDRIIIKNYGLLERFAYVKKGTIVNFGDVPMNLSESE